MLHRLFSCKIVNELNKSMPFIKKLTYFSFPPFVQEMFTKSVSLFKYNLGNLNSLLSYCPLEGEAATLIGFYSLKFDTNCHFYDCLSI